MIIDVIDLNLDTLNFTRRYDNVRYRRGTNIYNQGYVSVEKVNKIDDKNYYIEASVDGNYDTYTTTLRICGNMITDSSCTCEDYKNGYLCKHIIATSMEVLEPHYASTEAGKAKLLKKRKEEQQRQMEEWKRKQEEEKKRREYQAKYHTGLTAIEVFKHNQVVNSSYSLDLQELYESTSELKKEKAGELATSIRLEKHFK